MKTYNNVFVLGAGASRPFGFPSGWELKTEIIKNLAPSQEDISNTNKSIWIRFIEESEFSLVDIKEFYKALSRSGVSSVDYFLERRTEFIEIGKHAIALGISTKENEIQNGFFGEDYHWYNYLIQKLYESSFDKISNNNLAIITFNYDRSLEYFLYITMRNTYGKNENECANMLKNIPIIHVYGKLGLLPWEDGEIKRSYAFSTDKTSSIRKSAQCIKILHEGDDDSEEFVRARVFLQEASNVYFLGFGYNDTNMRRLGIGNLVGKGKYFAGTALGLGKTQVLSVCSRWSVFKTERLINSDILEFIRNYVQFSK